MATEVLNQRGTSREFQKRELDKTVYLFRRNGTALKRFLRNCYPTLTHVNSKSLILTLCGRLFKSFRVEICFAQGNQDSDMCQDSDP